MTSVRINPLEHDTLLVGCSRCSQGEGRWDRIAGKTYCPNCEEGLAVGEGPAVVERPRKQPCAVCERLCTLSFQTVPHQSTVAVEIDLCGDHLRALLGRRLAPYAFLQLQRRLRASGLGVEQIFLLHDAFYDANGRAIQPAYEMDS